MYLELAENCQSCLAEEMSDLLPIVDDETGEIYMINPATFVSLDREDQIKAIEQAPILMYILEKDNFNGMEGQLWENIKSKVKGFGEKVRNFFGGGSPQIAPTPGEFFGGASQINPRFGFSANIEPDPKPWFARPEVLLPVVGGGVLLVALMRKR